MIICDDFVVLNFPRTGSTFVREVIKDIYRKRTEHFPLLRIAQQLKIKKKPYTELLLPNYHSPNKLTRTGTGQHGAYCQIPEKYLNREIVTVIRNPYDIFLSTYQMGWWQVFLPIKKSEIKKKFPNYPILSIDEYVDLLKLSVEDKTSANIGIHTVQFIRMFFKNPEQVLDNISESYINSDELYKQDIAENITYLRQESLNDDLSSFISLHKFTTDEIDFVKKHKRVNVTANTVNNKNTLWTSKSINYVEETERFLFKLFKNFGAAYAKPVIPV